MGTTVVSEHKGSPQPQRFTAAIELLAKLTGVEVSLLTEPLALGFPNPQVTALQSTLLRKLHHQIPAELENALLKKNTRAMINALRDMMPAALRNTCPAEQLETIQSLLEILGFENARQFPLLARDAKQPIIDGTSIQLLSQSDRWMQTTIALLEDSFRREIKLLAKQRLGILCVWLAQLAGVSSKGEMRIALIELQAGRIRRHGNLYWTSGCYDKRRNERRRQWLTEEMVLLASSIDWNEAGFDSSQISHMVRDALTSLARLDKQAFAGLNRTSLLKASLARAFFVGRLPLFILEYMKGDISSSSLPEPVMARLFGRDPSGIDQCAEADQISPLDNERNDKPDHDTSENAPSTSPPTTRHNVLSQLSQKLYTSAPSAKREIQQFIKESRETADLPGLVDQLLEWCAQGLSSNKPRTVKMALDNLLPRLLGCVEDLDAINDPEAWAELVQQMTDGLAESSKSPSAISSFAKYLSQEIGEEFATAGSSGASSINAQLLTVEEVRAAASLLKQNLGADLGRMAELLLKLSFSTGLRRSEIDGLLAADVEFVRTAAIRVRKNKYRSLKTSNAARNVPLGYAEFLFPNEISELASIAERPSLQRDPTQLLFEYLGHDPLVDSHRLFNAISSALQQVTGEPKVKFHSLRHSFCSFVLLSFFYKQLELERFEEQLPYLRELRELGVVTRALLNPSGAIHRFELATIRGLMGHLSEQTTLQHYFHWCDLMRFAGFTRKECAVTMSPQAQLGASGKTQNTRGVGKHISDLEQVKSSIFETYTNFLPERTISAANVKVTNIDRTRSLKDDLTKAMAQTGRIVDGEQVDPLILDGFGQIPETQIRSTISWLDRTLLKTTFGRELPNPYKPLKDAGANDCLLTMLSNLEGKTSEELARIGGGLRTLLEHRAEPYMSYVFPNLEELRKTDSAISAVLSGFQVSYIVSSEIKIGRKYVAQPAVTCSSLLDVPNTQGQRYRMKMMRGSTERFPHRALIWLTTALSIVTDSTGLLDEPPQVIVTSQLSN